jgi:hypothetical protein
MVVSRRTTCAVVVTPMVSTVTMVTITDTLFLAPYGIFFPSFGLSFLALVGTSSEPRTTPPFLYGTVSVTPCYFCDNGRRQMYTKIFGAGLSCLEESRRLPSFFVFVGVSPR